MIEEPEKKSTFKNSTNVYISFYSSEGINIKASVKFIDVNEFRKKNLLALQQPQKREKTQEEIEETERISKELLDGFERNRPKFLHDFISENKCLFATFQSRAGSPWHIRREETLERRASVRDSRKKLFLAKMVKWQLVRKFRAEYLDK